MPRNQTAQRVYIDPAEPGSVARRMAEKMIDAANLRGSCTQDDLQSYGFTRAEIAAHGEKAREIAGQIANPGRR